MKVRLVDERGEMVGVIGRNEALPRARASAPGTGHERLDAGQGGPRRDRQGRAVPAHGRAADDDGGVAEVISEVVSEVVSLGTTREVLPCRRSNPMPPAASGI